MPSRSWLIYGVEQPPPQPRVLRAGAVHALLDGIDIRYLSVGGVELVRRVQVVVRDATWTIVPPTVGPLRVRGDGRWFEVDFTARHCAEELAFTWRGRIRASARGQFRYEMLGQADTAFDTCRLGLVVLHPVAGSAGQPFRMETDRGPVAGELPLLVGPMGSEGGVSRPLFEPFRVLELDLEAGGRVAFCFAGEEFEIEDQRNWADGNFKTYAMPIARGFPTRVEARRRLVQRVFVDATTVPVRPEGPVRLEVGEPLGVALPPIGFGAASHGSALVEREAELLRSLEPSHLRVDLHLAEVGWREALARARADAETLGCKLELALFVNPACATALDELAALLRGTALARVLVLDADARAGTPSETTSAALARLVRARLGVRVPYAGGTDRFFCELNRTRPDVSPLDLLCYSTHATFHELDHLSLVETLEAQGDTVRTARSFADGRGVVVSPTTFAGRAAPYGPGRSLAPWPLPPEVDPRQLSLFAAAWTLGSVKYTAEAGAASLTYFETTGWRGVVERSGGSPRPDLFPSQPGQVFPLWFAFAALAGSTGAELYACRSSAPLAAVGLAFRRLSGLRVVIANLTPRLRRIELAGLGPGATVREWLTEADLPHALLAPELHEPRTAPAGDVVWAPAYALLVIDTATKIQ